MKKYLIILISLMLTSNLFCITIPPISLEFNVFGFLGASKTFTQTDVKLKGDHEFYQPGLPYIKYILILLSLIK